MIRMHVFSHAGDSRINHKTLTPPLTPRVSCVLLRAQVCGIKEDLSGLGAGMEEMRGVCRQLQSHLQKIPDCSEAPFEVEADALVDRWLDVRALILPRDTGLLLLPPQTDLLLQHEFILFIYILLGAFFMLS